MTISLPKHILCVPSKILGEKAAPHMLYSNPYPYFFGADQRDGCTTVYSAHNTLSLLQFMGKRELPAAFAGARPFCHQNIKERSTTGTEKQLIYGVLFLPHGIVLIWKCSENIASDCGLVMKSAASNQCRAKSHTAVSINEGALSKQTKPRRLLCGPGSLKKLTQSLCVYSVCR